MAVILIGMPGIFLIAAGCAAFSFLEEGAIDWRLVALIAGIAVFSEIMDFVVGVLGARKFGTTRRGVIGAVIGMIIGAIVGTPVPVIGNLIGIFLGAFLGAFLFEYTDSHDSSSALKSATGAMLGKATAIGLKFVLGAICIVIIVLNITS